MYIGDYTGRRAIYSPDALAVVDAGSTPALRLTYAQLNDRANRMANWLASQGVGYGSRVGIIGHNGVPHLDIFFACAKLGAIHVPFNWRLHWVEQVQVINETGPTVLFYSEEFQADLAAVQADLKTVTQLVALEGPGLPGSLRYAEVLEAGSPQPVTYEALKEEDIAALIFTGGTTGLPKGAMISHKQIAWNTLNTIIHDLTHGDVTLNVFPLFHTGGIFVYVLPLLILGGTVVLPRKFDPTQVLELMESEKVTTFAGVPTMYQLITQSPRWKDADLSSLRFCTSGGAPLPVNLVQQYKEEKGVTFKQGFGMTEWGPGVFALAPQDAITHAGSIGRPNFYVEARVMDDAGNLLPAGQVGELVFKGPSGFSGYFQHPDATAAAFDAQGWFHTGDLAKHTEDQYFYIVDRKKDMFISGGENVFPAEIEAVLYRHPAVAQCAVVGLPDPRWGEVGVACVVLKPGQDATPEALLEHTRGQLARYKVPRKIVILPSLPISGAGKILKRELRERLMQE